MTSYQMQPTTLGSNSSSAAQNSIMASTEKWAVSPVCSRLRDHITLLNGNSCKERLFLQSPMTNRIAWPLNSPAFDPYKEINLASTGYNTTAQSTKYHMYGANSIFSELKNNPSGFNIGGSGGIGESPQITRKFMEFEPTSLNHGEPLFASALK